jgi:hypothetical protein
MHDVHEQVDYDYGYDSESARETVETAGAAACSGGWENGAEEEAFCPYIDVAGSVSANASVTDEVKYANGSGEVEYESKIGHVHRHERVVGSLRGMTEYQSQQTWTESAGDLAEKRGETHAAVATDSDDLREVEAIENAAGAEVDATYRL